MSMQRDRFDDVDVQRMSLMQHLIALFDYNMHRYGLSPGDTYAIAVSGGSDSMALLWLAHHWQSAYGGRIVALTVDHRLRQESATEAAGVGQWCHAQGIEHHILTWQHDGVSSAVQARARQARYDLMSQWCADHGIRTLLLAHHRDDQVETLLLRLARGTGAFGAAGISGCRWHRGVRFVRPLLSVAKKLLLDLAKAYTLPVVNDPSNTQGRFARVQARALLRSNPELTPRLFELTEMYGVWRHALECQAQQWLNERIYVSEAGWIEIRGGVTLGLKEARALQHVAQVINGGQYVPEWQEFLKLLRQLQNAPHGHIKTLAGCWWVKARNSLKVLREYRKCNFGKQPLVQAQRALWWDGRWRLEVPGELAARRGYIAPLGEIGARYLGRPLRREVLTFPGFWVGNHVEPIEATFNPLKKLDDWAFAVI